MPFARGYAAGLRWIAFWLCIATVVPGQAQVRPSGKPGRAATQPSHWNPRAPFATPPAELLAMVLPRSPKGVAAEILFSGVRVRIDANGIRSEQTHRIVRVRSQGGVDDYDDVSHEYDAWYQSRPTIKARVITPDGREHWLDPATLSEEAVHDGESYSSRSRLHAPLPALAPGAVLETLVECSEHQPFFQAGGRGREFLYAPTYAQAIQVTFDVDTRVAFAYEARGRALAPKVSAGAGRKQLVFELDDELPFAEWPDDAPARVSPTPLIEYGYARSWREVADAYAQQVDRLLSDFDAATLAHNVAGSASTPREKAAKLLEYLQRNVRYVALELGERSIVPAPPAQVLKQGFGDCKDKALLLVALLRALDVPADIALLETGPGIDVSPTIAGFGTFDHAIVKVRGTDAFWLDPSSQYAEVGVLPFDDQNRAALIVSADSTRLVQTPATGAASNTFSDEYAYAYPDLGGASVRETTTATGTYALSIRAEYDRDSAQLKQDLAEYVERGYGAEIETVTTALTGPEVKLVIQTAPSKTYQSGDDGVSLDVEPQGLLQNLPGKLTKPRQSERDAQQDEKLDPRTTKAPLLPLALRPELRSQSYVVTAAPGFVFDALPSDLDVRAGPFRLQRQSTLLDGGVRITYSLTTEQTELAATQVSTVHDAVLGFNDTAAVNVRARYAASRARTEGDYATAFKLHREAIARADNKTNALRRFAGDLAAIGLILPARRIAKAALASDSKNAWAHFSTGAVALYDDFGRLLRPGADVATVHKEYARAFELAPDDVQIQSGYAYMLQFGSDRFLYGKDSDPTHAREALLALRKKENTTKYDAAILMNLLWQRKFREAIAFAEALKETGPVIGHVWLAAVALSSGVEATVAKAAQLGGAQADELLAGAVSYLMLLAQYRVAAKVAAPDSVAKQMSAEQRSELTALAELDSCKKKLPQVVAAILAIEAKVMFGQQTPEQAVDLLKRGAGKGYINAYQLRAYLRSLVLADGTRSSGLPMDLARRTCVHTWRVDEGHDAVRVRRFVPGASRAETTYLLRKHGESFRLLSSSSGGSFDLARLIEEDLSGKRVETAEQWAVWLHEETKNQGGQRDRYRTADAINDVWSSRHRTEDRELSLWLIAAAATSGYDTSALTLQKVHEAKQRFADDPRLVMAADMSTALLLRFNRPEESLPLYEALRRSQPHDLPSWYDYVYALMRSRAYDSSLVEHRALNVENPDWDPAGLVYAESQAGQFAAAKARVHERLRQGKAGEPELNAVAWMALFEHGDELADAVEFAEEAVRLTKRRDFAAMHTLSVLYAERGRFDLALSTIREGLALTSSYYVPPSAWYVLGRVAEQLGFPDDARVYYERCREIERAYEDPLPEDPSRTIGSWRLAQLRLAALAK